MYLEHRTPERACKSRHDFTVPNTDEGRAWLALAKQYSNRDVIKTFRKRGRGNRSRFYHKHVAERINRDAGGKVATDDWRAIRKAGAYDSDRYLRNADAERWNVYVEKRERVERFYPQTNDPEAVRKALDLLSKDDGRSWFRDRRQKALDHFDLVEGQWLADTEQRLAAEQGTTSKLRLLIAQQDDVIAGQREKIDAWEDEERDTRVQYESAYAEMVRLKAERARAIPPVVALVASVFSAVLGAAAVAVVLL